MPTIPALWPQLGVPQPQRGGSAPNLGLLSSQGPHDHREPASCLGPCPARRGDSRDFPICSCGARKPDGTGRGARLPASLHGDRPCGSGSPDWGRSPPSWGPRHWRPWGHQLSVRDGASDRGTGGWEHRFSSTFRPLRQEKPQTCGVSLPPTGKQKPVLRFPQCRVLESSRKVPQDRSHSRRQREDAW